MHEQTDTELDALGSTPDELQALVARLLGAEPLTLARADELLASLSAGQSFADAVGVIGSISSPPPGLDSVAPPPGLDSAAPRSADAERAPMPWDSLPAPPAAEAVAAIPPPGALAAPPLPAAEPESLPPPAAARMPWDSSPAPETGDAQAQAIVAAFDAPEAAVARRNAFEEPDDGFRDTLESKPSPPVRMEPAPNLELDRPPRRGWSGSRRPDLDELLDQPLDALDFERTEQTDVVDTPVPEPGPEAEPAAAQEGQPADDFEILVDDEILEIAEDDVEIVDDENES